MGVIASLLICPCLGWATARLPCGRHFSAAQLSAVRFPRPRRTLRRVPVDRSTSTGWPSRRSPLKLTARNLSRDNRDFLDMLLEVVRDRLHTLELPHLVDLIER